MLTQLPRSGERTPEKQWRRRKNSDAQATRKFPCDGGCTGSGVHQFQTVLFTCRHVRAMPITGRALNWNRSE